MHGDAHAFVMPGTYDPALAVNETLNELRARAMHQVGHRRRAFAVLRRE
jgi:inosine/xanthosine triphosphate pyrophosphatase family protein